MAPHGEMKAQVETPAKMRAGVDSIHLVFEINARNRTIGSNRAARRMNSPWNLRRASVGQICLIRSARRRPVHRLTSLQDSALEGHHKTQQ